MKNRIGTLLAILMLLMPLGINALESITPLPEGAIYGFKNQTRRAGIDFSPTTSHLLAIGGDKETFLLDTTTGNPQKTLLGHTYGVGAVAFNADGSILATMSHDEVYLWDVDSGDNLDDETKLPVAGAFQGLDFGDGYMLAVLSKPEIYLSDITIIEDAEVVVFPDTVHVLTFGYGGTKIAAHGNGPFGQRGILYDIVSKEEHFFHEGGHSVWSEALSPNDELVAYGRTDGTINIWDVASLTQVKTFMAGGALGSLAFSPDGTLIASGSYGEVKLWDVESGDLIKTFTYPGDIAEYLVFNKDGTQLASSSWDNFVFVWDVPTTDTTTVVPTTLTTTPTASRTLSVDVNGDGKLSNLDLVEVALRFGQTGDNVADVNNDNIVDIADLFLVAYAIEKAAAAPALNPTWGISAADVHSWLVLGMKAGMEHEPGMQYLQHLFQRIRVTPPSTILLPNYPNPSNPETWIPYELVEAAEVSVTIHAADGQLVRTLDLGTLPAGTYQNKTHAAYWDGRNEHGEPVVSGVYFYTLSAGEFSATRKMVIRK